MLGQVGGGFDDGRSGRLNYFYKMGGRWKGGIEDDDEGRGVLDFMLRYVRG